MSRMMEAARQAEIREGALRHDRDTIRRRLERLCWFLRNRATAHWPHDVLDILERHTPKRAPHTGGGPCSGLGAADLGHKP